MTVTFTCGAVPKMESWLNIILIFTHIKRLLSLDPLDLDEGQSAKELSGCLSQHVTLDVNAAARNVWVALIPFRCHTNNLSMNIVIKCSVIYIINWLTKKKKKKATIVR